MSMTRKNYEAAASVIRDEVDLVTTGHGVHPDRVPGTVRCGIRSGRHVRAGQWRVRPDPVHASGRGGR